MNIRPTALLISNFPPPFGGVSNQVKQIGEQMATTLGIQAHVLDLNKRMLFVYDGTTWQGTPLLSARAVGRCALGLPAFAGDVWRRFGRFGLLRRDGFLVWRLALLVIAALVGQMMRSRPPRVVYSFHVGAPSLVGGFLASQLGIPHLKATFGEPFTNRNKLQTQRAVVLATGGATGYHPCSAHCQRLLAQLLPEITSEVLYYGSDLRELSQRAADLGKATNPKGDTPVRVLFLGRFVEEMGTRFFLDLVGKASRHYPGTFTFSMCGQAGELSTDVRTAQQRSDGALVVFESAPMQLRNQLLLEADILIVPSTNERACFGLAITEGLASRAFVIARDIGGHLEAALDDVGFTFARETLPEELVDRMNEVARGLRDGSLHSKLVAASAEVARRFDAHVCLTRQMQILSTAIANAPQRDTLNSNALSTE